MKIPPPGGAEGPGLSPARSLDSLADVLRYRVILVKLATPLSGLKKTKL